VFLTKLNLNFIWDNRFR